ncbi:hypothetical protein [Allosphingosinicella deserti]|uniref:Uncharacterized protein n=1 Tax=Allosphingosinicella deserti TaxID=2116704 RepID=A0A2P7QY43_9SPHN|nr:hypothetical protein [Sphingomonas deserti]PSJ42888.1 hypothetical protein C7I55_00235 [Sphingomonas deserti]
MLNFRRSLRAAAISSILAAAGSNAAFAQDQAPTTVGPPALKDFQLQGERTTPGQSERPPVAGPEITPAPAIPTVQLPRPTTTAPAPQRPTAATPPSVAPAPEGQPAARTPTRPTERPAPSAPQSQAAPSAGAVPEPAPSATLPQPGPAPAAPAPVPVPADPTSPAAPAAAAPSSGGNDWGWLWLAVPAAIGLIAFFALGRRRRQVRVRDTEIDYRTTAAETPRSVPPRAKPAAPAAPPVPRARLEIEFRADRAAATDTEARVHFDMVLRNVGDIEARNIRIDSRMFNASGESEIDGFLKGAIHEHSGSPHVTIEPGNTLELASMLSLPKSEVREIELQGRRVFVPVVAINVAYDWADGGKGRTSRSWLVGREAEQPSAKMGAFRLDLGPRIYRSVGQRPMRLANVA